MRAHLTVRNFRNVEILPADCTSCHTPQHGELAYVRERIRNRSLDELVH